jgi:hypothetical protein
VPLPESTDPDLVALCADALDFEADRRPTALQLAERLEAHRRPRSQKPAAKSGNLAAFAAVGIAGAVLGGIIVGLGASRRPPPKVASGSGATDVGGPTTAEIDDLLAESIDALGRDDRTHADDTARRALARLSSEDARGVRFHVVLGRDQLIELHAQAAEREYEAALALDPKNPHALLGSLASGLLLRDAELVGKRAAALDAGGFEDRFLTAMRAFRAADQKDPLARLKLDRATQLFDPPLVRAVGSALLGRTP